MLPLVARCRACGGRTSLATIAGNADGRCPACGTPFSPEWTLLLIEECASLEQLLHALVRSLRRLSGLPGNLELQPDELFAKPSTEVPWKLSIDTEPASVAAEVGELARRLDDENGSDPTAFVGEARGLATSLMGLATILEANQEAVDPTSTGAGDAARDAARHLTETADAIDRGESEVGALRAGLRDAAEAT